MGKPPNRIKISSRFPTYSKYLITEWEGFKGDPDRWAASLTAVSDIPVNRVLDIGCGAGQEMLPFVSKGAKGVGIDLMPEAGQVGLALFGGAGMADRVTFIRAVGSVLPFANEVFDVLICRVALSYMDNRGAIREMARVLRPGGKVLLKYATPSYYWQKAREGVVNSSPLTSIYAARVLYAGYVYQLTGRQPFGRLTAGGEIFQTERTLLREMSPLGLHIDGHLPDSNKQTPSVVITKSQAAKAAQYNC